MISRHCWTEAENWMTDQIKEQISAFLDDELPMDEARLLVRRMERDESLRRTFRQYVLAGELLRAPGAQIASPGFAARVMAAIDEQPAVTSAVGGDVRSAIQPWARTALAAGIAASVLGVAVLLGRADRSQPLQIAEAPVPTAVPVQATAATPGGAAASREDLPLVSPTPEERQRMTGYILAHGQFATPMARRTVWSGVLADDPQISTVSYQFDESP